LVKETGADALLWNRRYEPLIRERDARIKETLRGGGVLAESHNAALLNEPWTIQNKSGKPFQVFTPYWKHCLALTDPPAPLEAPKRLPTPAKWPVSVQVQEFGLSPVPDWAGGLRTTWQPGTEGARAQFDRFLKLAFQDYGTGRNRPDLVGTSRLSPHLHFGEISPRQVWHALKAHAEKSGLTTAAWRQSQYLAEIGWREFAHHLIYHFPHTPTECLRPEFAKFRWRRDAGMLKAWQRGETGYPFVDAGMRELWSTGWMHNRVRMVVASFLVKDLMIPWQEGAKWFWDTLVDADLAQNTLGWQWTAGCGADAAPFFRVFNPVGQGERFDPQGSYVRRWVPELAALPDEWIHKPHQAPPEVLKRAGIELGKSYPEPVINHAIAREVALEAYARLKKKG
jgi:deoxyribodipyrimidine photo-lyase